MHFCANSIHMQKYNWFLWGQNKSDIQEITDQKKYSRCNLLNKLIFSKSSYKTAMTIKLQWCLKTAFLPATALSFLGLWSVLMLWCESLSSLGSVSTSGAQGRRRSRRPREYLLLLGHTLDLAGGLTKRLPHPPVRHTSKEWELKDNSWPQ